MKAVIIGASSEALHTIEMAHKHGLNVVALDGNPDAQGLKAADQGLVVDISDEAATIEAVRREGADFVLTVPIGRYLTSIGAVNDVLGLPGISRQMAVICTDKFRFHQCLQEKGLRNCHCYLTEQRKITGSDGTEYEREDLRKLGLKFPVILKPRYGSGSRGIYMANSMEEMENALEEIGDESYVLEECVAGEEYGIDGVVTKDGFQMILLRKKENTPPPARQAVGYLAVQRTDVFWQQVYTYMKQVTEHLNLRECLLHADIIRGEKGPFVIELSARPSGHNLHNLFTPLSTGVDMAEEYIKYRMGLSYCFEPNVIKPMIIHYFDMQGMVTRIPTEEEVRKTVHTRLAAWECNIKAGEKLKPVSDGHSVMGRGYFILQGEDEKILKEDVLRVKELFFSFHQ